MSGSEPSQQWENFFGVLLSSLWFTHPVDMGFDFIVIAPLLLSPCRFFFLVGSSILL